MVTFAIWEFLHKVCPAGPEKDNAVHKRDIRPDPSLLDHHHCHIKLCHHCHQNIPYVHHQVDQDQVDQDQVDQDQCASRPC